MKPVDFKEANSTLKAPQSMADCEDLRVFTDNKECISCWSLTIWERIRAVLFGRVWVFVLSGHSQPPISLSIEKTVFLSKDPEDV